MFWLRQTKRERGEVEKFTQEQGWNKADAAALFKRDVSTRVCQILDHKKKFNSLSDHVKVWTRGAQLLISMCVLGTSDGVKGYLMPSGRIPPTKKSAESD